MIELIGVATLVALVWLLAYSMTTESDAERRRTSLPMASSVAERKKAGTRHAA